MFLVPGWSGRGAAEAALADAYRFFGMVYRLHGRLNFRFDGIGYFELGLYILFMLLGVVVLVTVFVLRANTTIG